MVLGGGAVYVQNVLGVRFLRCKGSNWFKV